MRYEITPVAKPRMTIRDKRLPKRPVVAKYHAFKDEIRFAGVKLPEYGAVVHFHLPMPKSWSKKKKQKNFGMPHKQTPDLDNMLKALLDSIYQDDKKVWNIRDLSKFWAYEGAIVIIVEGDNG